jgi:hypothetical protein
MPFKRMQIWENSLKVRKYEKHESPIDKKSFKSPVYVQDFWLKVRRLSFKAN